MASASPSSVPQGRVPDRRKRHASLAGTGRASSCLTNTKKERVMARVMMKLYLNLGKGAKPLDNKKTKFKYNQIMLMKSDRTKVIKYKVFNEQLNRLNRNRILCQFYRF